MRLIDRLLIVIGDPARPAADGLGHRGRAGRDRGLGLFVVPPDADQGDVQRLMYVHVPAAWLAFLSFGVVFLASVAYLKTGRIRWDRVAVASAEIGVLFCVLTLVLGSLWGRPVWGTWWTWDPRLTTTVVLLLIYVGYLSLRKRRGQSRPARPVVGRGRGRRVRRRADRAHVRRLVALAAPGGDGDPARNTDHGPAACSRPAGRYLAFSRGLRLPDGRAAARGAAGGPRRRDGDVAAVAAGQGAGPPTGGRCAPGPGTGSGGGERRA